MTVALALPGGPRVVLASGSAARAGLLRAAGVPFEPIVPAVDEAALREALRAEGVTVRDAAVALAELKAQRVAMQVGDDAIVLGGDQLLEHAGEWLEKPVDRAAARAQLLRLRGEAHTLAAAVVAFRNGTRVWHHVDTATVHVRPFSDVFLEAYLDAAGEAVTASVGAYQIEGLGAQLLARVRGDHATVLGLPLLPLLEFLREQGVLPR